jgi:hypothetical protein
MVKILIDALSQWNRMLDRETITRDYYKLVVPQCTNSFIRSALREIPALYNDANYS